MKPLAILLTALVVSAVGFGAGYRIAATRTAEKPSYLAVSLSGDRFLHAVSTVVQDEEGRYVMRGDEIQFFSGSPKSHESSVRPFVLEFRRWDYFSPIEPRGASTLVSISERDKEETFIVRGGKAVKIDPIGKMNP